MKKADAAIIAAVLLLSAALFVLPWLYGGDELYAVVYENGEQICRVSLSGLSEPKTLEAGGCTVVFEGDGAYILKSTCPDGLCVRQGKLKSALQSAVCVPNKVVLVLESGSENKEYDALAY